MPIDRNAKLTAKWIREHCPDANETFGGVFEIAIRGQKNTWGDWLFGLSRPSRGARQVRLACLNRNLFVGAFYIRRVSTAGELIDLYNCLSATPWPGTEAMP